MRMLLRLTCRVWIIWVEGHGFWMVSAIKGYTRFIVGRSGLLSGISLPTFIEV